MIRLLDRFGFGYAANIRGPVHYLTGCKRRVPLVVVFGVVMAVMDVAGLVYTPPQTALGALWDVGTRLLPLWLVLGIARGVARDLDAGPSAVLPREYPDVLWVGRLLMTLFLGSLALGIVASSLNVRLTDPPKGPPFSFVWFLAAMAGVWISTHQGGAGKHTLAGHVRQLWALRRHPSLAGVKG